jgi:Zn-dependent peptidase ImmA (M78 family)
VAIEERVADIVGAVGYKAGEVDLLRVGAVYGGNPPKVVLNASPTLAEIASGVHGRISFDPLEIVIYEHPSAYRPRKRFTHAHELGHLILQHSRYFVSECFAQEDFASFGDRGLASTSMQRLEWQANYFANALLLPGPAFRRCFARVARQLDLSDHGHGLLYVDAQPTNIRTLHHVTLLLANEFKVSQMVVEIRLRALGLVNDTRRAVERLAFG